MDGINPTLAFAALFFGLSGHPHDAAERPVEPEHSSNWESPADPSDQPPSDQSAGYLFDCPGTAIAVDDENTPIAPQDFGPLQDHQVALTSSVLSLDPDAGQKPAMPDELSGEIFQDDCSALAPRP
ncbi:MAG TPA: hypothetical protein VG742_11590 [Dongiaceae bacterium]|nr:hypothetical protein [Dongiaceae bacterium]